MARLKKYLGVFLFSCLSIPQNIRPQVTVQCLLHNYRRLQCVEHYCYLSLLFQTAYNKETFAVFFSPVNTVIYYHLKSRYQKKYNSFKMCWKGLIQNKERCLQILSGFSLPLHSRMCDAFFITSKQNIETDTYILPAQNRFEILVVFWITCRYITVFSS